MSADGPAQPALFGPTPRRRRSTAAAAAAGADGGGAGLVAAVVVDVPLPHLDHPFSYQVPERLRGQLRPGARVQVPFAGRTEDGWVLSVSEGPVAGLRPVRRVVTPQPPLTPEVAALARAVADSTAGTLADVLRAALPPRHAAAERLLLSEGVDGSGPGEQGAVGRPGVEAAAGVDAEHGVAGPAGPGGPAGAVGAWGDCAGGTAFLQRTRAGEGPRAAVRLPLDADPWHSIATAVVAALGSGRDAVVVLPDVVAVEACAAVLHEVLTGLPGTASGADPGAGAQERLAVLHHGLGPAARWREFLRVRLGRARVVVGTRSAVFAPLVRPGLVVVWDDGDDAHVEPHSPGWDSAGVALLRAEASGAALALVSHSRSVRTQEWVRTGRVKDVSPHRAARRRGAPRVVVPDPADPLEVHARVPRAAHRVAAEALRSGPVLVSVPRSGYATALQCRRCRHAARCRHCSGALSLAGPGAGLVCGWCARTDATWVCPECTGTQVRAGVVGAARSAEELGRAFPGVPVLLSRGGERSDRVADTPRLVVATPGAEPGALGGYAAALVLDGDLALARRGLAVEEETLRRWLAVAALVRPGDDGGRLVLVADPSHRVVQAVVQDAPEALAERLCEERSEVGLPPVRCVARVLGAESDLVDVAATLRGEGTLLPEPATAAASRHPVTVDDVRGHDGAGGPAGLAGEPAGPPTVLGPAPTEEPGHWQLLLTGARATVLPTVKNLLATRSAAKAPGRLVVRVDPHDLD